MLGDTPTAVLPADLPRNRQGSPIPVLTAITAIQDLRNLRDRASRRQFDSIWRHRERTTGSRWHMNYTTVNVKFAYSLYRFFRGRGGGEGGNHLVTLTSGRVSRCEQRRVACDAENSGTEARSFTRVKGHIPPASAPIYRAQRRTSSASIATCPRMYITRGQEDGRHASRSYIREDGRGWLRFPHEARSFTSSAKTECGLNVASTCLRLRFARSRHRKGGGG